MVLQWMRQQESGESCVMRSFMLCCPHQILLIDQNVKNEVGGACSMYGREEKCIQSFGGET